MRILTVEEIPTGGDEVMSAQFTRGRELLGVTLADAADATGASVSELSQIEGGKLTAFSDGERLRQVVLAYCGYLGIEPGPILSRLEAYADWELLHPPHLFALPEAASAPSATPQRMDLLIFSIAVLFMGGWVILRALDG